MKKWIPLFIVAAGLAVTGCNKTDNGSTTTDSQPASSATPGASSSPSTGGNMGGESATNAPAGVTNATPPQ